MKCASCHHENEADALFCEGCGEKVVIGCLRCGIELNATARFCRKCGAPTIASLPAHKPTVRRVADYTPKHLAEKILQSKSALEGERKHVTVLFADIKGSMALSHEVGAETWHRILDQFFRILGEGVHRYEGTINQYTGDGIMALFGAPIAHEDHATRACYAALRLREDLSRFALDVRLEHGLNLGVRIGLNSGDVVVGKIGDDLRMDYTAQGHTVGLAQRIEGVAAAGRVYLGDATRRLVDGLFDLKDLSTANFKGVDAPVPIFELVGLGELRTRLDVARAKGLSRFVGREAELGALNSVLQRVRDGYGQVVGVVGEAGVGKSRLCHEFIEQCRASGVAIYKAHCLSHGQSVPLMPILELLRDYFQIGIRDEESKARRKIADTLLNLDVSLRSALPLIFEFMGVGDPLQQAPTLDAEARQAQLFAIIREIFRLMSAHGVVAVIFINDLQWIDSVSEIFLADIVEAITSHSRALLLTDFRPGYEASWMRRGHYQQVSLMPLFATAATALVEELIGRHPSLSELAGRIIARTAGNPFYAEEVVRSLTETDCFSGVHGAYRLASAVGEVDIPHSVNVVIQARIDRLTGEAKTVLQAASVIGKTCRAQVLDDVAALPTNHFNSALQRLQDGGFLSEVASYPERVYAFNHPLLQEVAYSTQLTTQRAAKHAAAALALESNAADRVDEQAALIAYHWDTACEPARALEWYERSARWAVNNDTVASVRYWRRVREIVDLLPGDADTFSRGAEACTCILNLGWQLGATEDEGFALLQEGASFAERAGNRRQLAQLYSAFASLRGISGGRADDYVKYAERAVEIAESDGDEATVCAVQMRFLHANFLAGRHAVVSALGSRLITDIRGLAPDTSTIRALPVSLMVRATSTLMCGGDAERARADYEESLSLTMQLGMPEMAVAVYGNYGLVSALAGDVETALRLAAEADDIAANLGTGNARCWAHFIAGRAALAAGDLDRAVERFEAFRILSSERRSSGMLVASNMTALAETELMKGKIEQASALAQSAVELAADRGLFWDLTPWVDLARIHEAAGETDRAVSARDIAHKRISECGAVLFSTLSIPQAGARSAAHSCATAV